MKLYPIQCGKFKLDGGAMFGVVPKTLWEKTNPADDRNLIELGTRSLLVEDGKKLILIDCGLGNNRMKSSLAITHCGAMTLWIKILKNMVLFGKISRMYS